MKITQSTKLSKYPLCIFISENGIKGQNYPSMAKTTMARIKKAFEQEIFTGKPQEILQLTDTANPTFLIGTGKEKDAKDMQKCGGVALKIMKSKKYSQCSFCFNTNTEHEDVVFGALLGNYSFKIGDKSEMIEIKELKLISENKLSKQTLADIQSRAMAVNTTRELVNLPTDHLQTGDILEHAKGLAKKGKNIKVSIIDEKKAEKLGMGALLAVGQGSDAPTGMALIEYTGGKKKEAPLAFVGKGISFDTGGYNLKPNGYIMDMKMDMGGAATVLGLFEWIAATQPSMNAIGVIPTAENMISSNAYRPGDIITSMSGKTIEIGNTDAEGRLILADALYYTATKYKPASMIDIATLTGAVIAALGNEITGVMGNNPKLIKSVLSASKRVQEDAWELPITDTFREVIKNDVSDLKNIDRPVGAGSSVAGAFLENFVEDIPWAHLDIAGTAWTKSESPLGPRGATGAMVQTLIQYVQNQG